MCYYQIILAGFMALNVNYGINGVWDMVTGTVLCLTKSMLSFLNHSVIILFEPGLPYQREDLTSYTFYEHYVYRLRHF